MKPEERHPSLFDAAELQAQDDLPRSTWQEVPAALFNSWSDARQLAYCALRDEDGALYANTLEEALWFQARARSYKEMQCQTMDSPATTNPLSELM